MTSTRKETIGICDLDAAVAEKDADAFSRFHFHCCPLAQFAMRITGERHVRAKLWDVYSPDYSIRFLRVTTQAEAMRNIAISFDTGNIAEIRHQLPMEVEVIVQ